MVVEGCPCGDRHLMSAEVRDAIDAITAGLADTVPVIVRGRGAYRVPRLYIACHGLAAADLPGIAERYGFQPAGPA
jgi:hypothetical protein